MPWTTDRILVVTLWTWSRHTLVPYVFSLMVAQDSWGSLWHVLRRGLWFKIFPHLLNIRFNVYRGTLLSAFPRISDWVVAGEQTVARAELMALLVAVKKASLVTPFPRAEFVTDASYVLCKIVRLIELNLVGSILHKLNHGDLISELASLWKQDIFLWQGWRAIDLLNWPLTIPTFGVLLEAIAETLQQMRPTNWCLVKFGRSATSVFHTVRWRRLNYLPIIFYLVDLNRERCRLLEILKSDGNSSSLLRPRLDESRQVGLFDSHAMGWEALEFMKNWTFWLCATAAYCLWWWRLPQVSSRSKIAKAF